MQIPTLSPSLRAWWIVLAVLVALYMLGTWLNRRRSKKLGCGWRPGSACSEVRRCGSGLER